jgi:hypothetical protein
VSCRLGERESKKRVDWEWVRNGVPRDELDGLAVQAGIWAIITQTASVEIAKHKLAYHGNSNRKHPDWQVSSAGRKRFPGETGDKDSPKPQSQYHFLSNHIVTWCNGYASQPVFLSKQTRRLT